MSTRSYRKPRPEPMPIPLDGSASITSIRACSDDPTRVSLSVNRQRVGRILLQTKVKYELQVGTAWTQDLAESLRQELARGNAYRAAVRILTKRAKSGGELRLKLREYKYEQEAIEWTIERLTELGILNDEEYARMVVRSQLSRKPAGRRFLQGKLREKGIDQATSDRVLDELLDDRDTMADARKIAEQAARSISDRYEPEVRARRISGRLARRGFDFDVIRRILEELDL